VFTNGEPPVLLGHNEGANPVEFLLHALAGCVTTTTVLHAAARGIEIESLSTRLVGDIDLQRLLALADVPAGYRQIRIEMDLMIMVGSIVLRVDDLARQRAFWAAALDYVPRDDTSDDFVLLRPRNGIGPNLSLDRHHSTLQVPPRIHLDLYADDQAAEVQRLIALGATKVVWNKRPADADYVILADPEGNRFCVVDAAR
jgi:hypothetical protein